MRKELLHDFEIFQKSVKYDIATQVALLSSSRYKFISRNVKLEGHVYDVTFDTWGGYFMFRSHEKDLIYAIVKGDLGSKGKLLISPKELQDALDEGVIRGMLES